MRSLAAAVVLSLMLLAPAAAPSVEGRSGPPPEAQLVTFPGPDGATELRGFLYLPPGKGLFPAVLWNHGSEKLPGWQPDLARFYNAQGFVFFIPHRRGQGRSPGPYIMDRVSAQRRPRLSRLRRQRPGRTRRLRHQTRGDRDLGTGRARLLQEGARRPGRADERRPLTSTLRSKTCPADSHLPCVQADSGG
jgi:hypothetical protein